MQPVPRGTCQGHHLRSKATDDQQQRAVRQRHGLLLLFSLARTVRPPSLRTRRFLSARLPLMSVCTAHRGSAPVFDSCGRAGGHLPPALSGKASFGGVYINTTHAKLGDDGSKTLEAALSGVVWSAGRDYEVAWAVEANHAGGYSYRLAPAAGPLTEAEFQKMHLKFVGQQRLRWGGGPAHGGSEIAFNATDVEIGTVPRGSVWRQNPIPREGGFAPHCNNSAMCSGNRPVRTCTAMVQDILMARRIDLRARC